MSVFLGVVAELWKEEDLFRRNEYSIAQAGVFVAFCECVEDSVLPETKTHDPECSWIVFEDSVTVKRPDRSFLLTYPEQLCVSISQCPYWTAGRAHANNNACEKAFVTHVEVQLLFSRHTVRPVRSGVMSLLHCLVAVAGNDTVQSDDLVLDSVVDSSIVAPDFVAECVRFGDGLGHHVCRCCWVTDKTVQARKWVDVRRWCRSEEVRNE